MMNNPATQSHYSNIDEIIELFDREKIASLYHDPVSTGFPLLDKALGGGLDGMTVLGAMSGMGKSTFALQIAANAAQKGSSVLYFSLEMPRVRMVSKLLSRQIFIHQRQQGFGIEAYRFASRKETSAFGPQEWAAIQAGQKALAQYGSRLYIQDAEASIFTARGIEDAVLRFLDEKKEKPLIIVDYLQILSSDKPMAQPRQIVDESIQTLRRLSTEHSLPVLLISSFNRVSYNKPIGMEAFKESGNIEYSADIILGLQCSAVRKKSDFDLQKEKSKSPRDMEIVILKQRYGQTWETGIPFHYYSQYDYFEELSGTMGSADPALQTGSVGQAASVSRTGSAGQAAPAHQPGPVGQAGPADQQTAPAQEALSDSQLEQELQKQRKRLFDF